MVTAGRPKSSPFTAVSAIKGGPVSGTSRGETIFIQDAATGAAMGPGQIVAYARHLIRTACTE